NDSINYLADRAELEAALVGMRANLGESGLLLFDVNTLLSYRTFFAKSWVVEDGALRLTWTGRASSDQPPASFCEALVEAEDSVARQGTKSHIHRQRHFLEAEVLAALENAGLESLDVFGQDEAGALGQPLDEGAHVKALYLARKAHDAHRGA